jgi:hypothetical protein
MSIRTCASSALISSTARSSVSIFINLS